MKRTFMTSIMALAVLGLLAGCGRAGKPVGTCKAETFPEHHPS